jgi:hypothetical protein
MKTILTLFLFLTIVTSAIASGIEGTWIANMPGPDGNGMELTFVFKMEVEKLTGFVKSPNGDMPISNAQIKDKEFSFEVSFNEMVIKHKCTLKEDGTISMKIIDSPMGDSEIILKRKE